jgi:ABC-type antimicrobial peptide transport system permease subunit
MVVGNAARLGAVGLLLGVAIAYATEGMEALLAGIKPGDGEAFGAAVVLTAVMLVAGTLVPALRAVRIDPISAIRSE